jgi:hypothetical protein
MARNKQLLVSAFVLNLLIISNCAIAQSFRLPFVHIDRSYGEVRVQAPFVDVYRGPGMTSVRAPFTNVVRPGYQYPNPYYGPFGLYDQRYANPWQQTIPPGYVAVPYPGRPGYFILQPAQQTQANRPATRASQTSGSGVGQGPDLLPPDVDPGLPRPPVAVENLAGSRPRLMPVPETPYPTAGRQQPVRQNPLRPVPDPLNRTRVAQSQNVPQRVQSAGPRNLNTISIELSESVTVILDDESDDDLVVVRSRKSKTRKPEIQQVAGELEPPILEPPTATVATTEPADGEPGERHTLVIPIDANQPIPRMNVVVGGMVSRPSRGSKFYELTPIPHSQLQRYYKPQAGLHVFALIHPLTRQPFAVQIRLPDGQPTIDVKHNGVVLDFDGKQRTIEFTRDGGVIVRGQ